ncbi:VWA domain-containing protein [Candidatus Dependentiae bacterium]|nr:VWA domain-containing protein [Candidatus Dependentiae bacterium]
MIFAAIQWWPIALLVIIIATGASLYALYRRRQIVKLLDPRAMTFGVRWHRRAVIGVIAIMASAVLLAVALLRPQWGVATTTVDATTKDLFIALDLSQSMLATDVAPSRLGAAQQCIERLLSQLPIDRVGLIIFADKPTLQLPLTHDIALVRSFLAEAPLLVGGGGTRFDLLLQLVTRHLVDGSKRQKLLLIVSDGEDFSGKITQEITRLQEAGITVIAIGVGTTTGAPVPKPAGQGFVNDAQGNPVISRLQPQILQQLAAQTDGVYLPLSTGKQIVHDVTTIVTMTESGKLGAVAIDRFIDRYMLFAAMAVIGILMGMIV